MQLRFECDLTGEEYVTERAWRNASLSRCPLHPNGGCGFARHGTYERASPPGTRIARWYCPRGHRTFSLLPDCLAARLPGTLEEVEAVVRQVEQSPSLEAACGELRLDIELPGVLRWVRRRVAGVRASLHLLRGLFPEPFSGCAPSLAGFAQHLGVAAVLPALRQIAAPLLIQLPAPLGFRPPRFHADEPAKPDQHPRGPDPPLVLA